MDVARGSQRMHHMRRGFFPFRQSRTTIKINLSHGVAANNERQCCGWTSYTGPTIEHSVAWRRIPRSRLWGCCKQHWERALRGYTRHRCLAKGRIFARPFALNNCRRSYIVRLFPRSKEICRNTVCILVIQWKKEWKKLNVLGGECTECRAGYGTLTCF